MFFPQLFGIVGEKLVYTKDHQYDDPEDLYDDRYLLEVRTCPRKGDTLFPEFVDVECFLAVIGFIAFFLNDSLPQ